MSMELSLENILKYASRYDYKGPSDQLVENELKGWFKSNRYLSKDLFLKLCIWKSSRPKRHYMNNEDQTIRRVTNESLSANDEQVRVEKLLKLNGVGYPVASVILHFSFPEKYPILDRRALFSIGWPTPSYYNFRFWDSYCKKIRQISQNTGLSIRIIDKALWQYSKEHQSKLNGQTKGKKCW